MPSFLDATTVAHRIESFGDGVAAELGAADGVVGAVEEVFHFDHFFHRPQLAVSFNSEAQDEVAGLFALQLPL